MCLPSGLGFHFPVIRVCVSVCVKLVSQVLCAPFLYSSACSQQLLPPSLGHVASTLPVHSYPRDAAFLSVWPARPPASWLLLSLQLERLDFLLEPSRISAIWLKDNLFQRAKLGQRNEQEPARPGSQWRRKEPAWEGSEEQWGTIGKHALVSQDAVPFRGDPGTAFCSSSSAQGLGH